MKLHRLSALGLLALASSASMADTFSAALDLSAGNTGFGRSNAVGAFTDTWSFTLAGSSWYVTSTASSAASGLQNLNFSSLVIEDAANNVVATYAGNLGTDATEFYALNQTLLAAGDYRLIVTGVNSQAQASYSGNIAVSAVPEPASGELLVAGLAVMGFMAGRRRAG
jgi:hypothetical protein